MNVLALTSSYPRFDGDPTAPFIESITRHLVARGHTTHLVLPEHVQWRRPPVEDGISFHTYRYSPRRSWTPWGYANSLEEGVRIRRGLYPMAPIVALSALRSCNALTAVERFDLVHAHWLVPNGPIAVLAARRRRLPLVISLHGSDVSVSQKSAWLGKIARWALGHAAAVTAPSEDLLERAIRLGARGHLELIPYGADPADFEPAREQVRIVRERLGLGADDILVLGIGRFVRMKGFGDLIDAVGRAPGERAAIRLVLVGDGDLRGELVEHASRLGIADRVTFAGMAVREDVPVYFGAADIVVVPSVHDEGHVDGLPNVALEAMAAAKPVIATRVGGLPHVVRDGENGLLVDEGDPDALARAIEVLASDSELRQAMGNRGRDLVRGPLSWDATADRFAAVYERVVYPRT